jgi:hypothetical protein
MNADETDVSGGVQMRVAIVLAMTPRLERGTKVQETRPMSANNTSSTTSNNTRKNTGACRIAAVAIAVIATVPIVSASAHTRDRYDQGRAYGEIQAERERQRSHVEQGRNDGSITWTEKYSLSREQARIEQLEREALADGRLDRDEYRTLRQAQDDAARHIHTERHDNQVRGFWWRLWR